jgi:hypothetical protein
MRAQLQHLASRGQNRPGILPAMHTITELARFSELEVRCDGGCSDVAKYRSRMLAEFLGSAHRVWLTIDDDVSASREVLKNLLTVVERDAPAIAIAPCVLRDGATVNVEWTTVIYDAALPNGAKIRRAKRAGFGLVAMNRAAAEAVEHATLEELLFRPWIDDDGQKKAPAFFPDYRDGRWFGEDVSFFRRVPPTVEVWALLEGETVHAGYALELAELA